MPTLLSWGTQLRCQKGFLRALAAALLIIAGIATPAMNQIGATVHTANAQYLDGLGARGGLGISVRALVPDTVQVILESADTPSFVHRHALEAMQSDIVLVSHSSGFAVGDARFPGNYGCAVYRPGVLANSVVITKVSSISNATLRWQVDSLPTLDATGDSSLAAACGPAHLDPSS